MGEIEAGAYCLDLMDLVIDQALDYLDRFDQPYGLLIILNQCPIKKKWPIHNLDDQDGLKMGPKLNYKGANIVEDPN